MNVAIPESQPVILKRVFGGADLERSDGRREIHSRSDPTNIVGACLLLYDYTSLIESAGFRGSCPLTEAYRDPSRLQALPMYLMLALTREGYRHAVRSELEF